MGSVQRCHVPFSCFEFLWAHGVPSEREVPVESALVERSCRLQNQPQIFTTLINFFATTTKVVWPPPLSVMISLFAKTVQIAIFMLQSSLQQPWDQRDWIGREGTNWLVASYCRAECLFQHLNELVCWSLLLQGFPPNKTSLDWQERNKLVGGQLQL